MSHRSNAARVWTPNAPLVAGFMREERELRQQRAHDLGPSDARHLRLVADDIDEDGIIELPGVDAERLRLLAAKLEDDECEIASLREHANNVHRALCEAIDDLDAQDDDGPVTFVFVADEGIVELFGPESLTPEQFSDLAVFVLDEIE